MSRNRDTAPRSLDAEARGERELFLGELELIRRLCAQIPAPRQHLIRYFGY